MSEKELETTEFKSLPAISTGEYTHSAKNIEIKDDADKKEAEVDNFKEKAEDILVPIIKNARAQGIRIGMLSCSKIVMEKLNDKSKSLMDRITDVRNFCNVAIKNDKFLDGVAPEDKDDVNE